MPLPSGTAPLTPWEAFQEKVETLWTTFKDEADRVILDDLRRLFALIWAFFLRNLPVFGVLAIVWAIVWAIINRTKKYRQSVQRTWLFLLYFLSKRQMMIPLVHTLSAREGITDEASLAQLVAIRQQCRGLSLRRDPEARITAERNLSKVLYGYFLHLDEIGELKDGSPLAKVAEDLQFIDGKLVTLQEKYNEDALHFNDKILDGPWGALFFRPLGFRKFSLFATSEG